jgi:multiple sugar transport system substrate-binding protein
VSSTNSYIGLTWDHPRGYVALELAAEQARAEGLSLRWERQPLEGFESHPIEELAQQYDIIVLDHPHLGDAVHAQCLQPLEAIFDAVDIAQWRAQSIGQAFNSYGYAGQHWALPLDAASQVGVMRPDLLEEPAPKTWVQVGELAGRRPVCLSLAGPHALLTLFSISAAFGEAPLFRGPETLLAGNGAVQAWDVLSELYGKSFKGWLDKNPIGILQAMSEETAAVYCPLVYGYVTYAAPSGGCHRLQFVDVPAGPSGLLGSTLGGTGIGISRRAKVNDQLKAHLVGLLSLRTQAQFIPFADGQPSARDAWADAAVNTAWNNFFAGTSATLEKALVRPRHPGYVPFQTKASSLVRNALEQHHSASQLLSKLQALYEQHRPANSEV